MTSEILTSDVYKRQTLNQSTSVSTSWNISSRNRNSVSFSMTSCIASATWSVSFPKGSDGFYRRQLVLTTKEKPTDRADDPDLAEKMKTEAEGIFLWALEGLQRLVANNFQFTESDRIRENREAVKRDNNNIFDFMDSEGYIQRKADASISSKDFYEIYRMWCEENSLAPLKARSFSDAMIANAGRFNLEHCNNITNSAGRRVWGFMGVEAVARPHINGFYDVSSCTYVPEEWRD